MMYCLSRRGGGGRGEARRGEAGGLAARERLSTSLSPDHMTGEETAFQSSTKSVVAVSSNNMWIKGEAGAAWTAPWWWGEGCTINPDSPTGPVQLHPQRLVSI